MNPKSKILMTWGSLLAALYFCTNHVLPLPDFIMGFIMGAAIVCFILSALPEETLRKIKRWKHHG